MTFNYTFSKALGIRGAGQGAVGNQLDLRQNYGPLAYDRTHIFNAAYSIELGSPVRNNKVVGGLINGWQVSGITQVQSGVNLQAANGNANFNFNATGPDGNGLTNKNIAGTPDVTLMPRLTCNPSENLQDGQYVNGACFAAPTPGRNGDYVMPYIKGPGFFNSDLSLFKNFQISEHKKLQFRFSGFNFLNHPIRSFTNSDANLNLTLDQQGRLVNQRFGYADTKYGHRVIQLAVKFYF
jgi:hypothetical protein